MSPSVHAQLLMPFVKFGGPGYFLLQKSNRECHLAAFFIFFYFVNVTFAIAPPTDVSLHRQVYVRNFKF